MCGKKKKDPYFDEEKALVVAKTRRYSESIKLKAFDLSNTEKLLYRQKSSDEGFTSIYRLYSFEGDNITQLASQSTNISTLANMLQNRLDNELIHEFWDKNRYKKFGS